ncbi:MAG: hypothetical protein B7Y39_12195 [Bdellovibrio sp. 28-41-41]|nr:MAG: hypothetical protein B7Y39_12195 [Bdellovibrio sp. 28-41-41]
MDFLKRKTFWYATISLLVFCTDIWVYFHLKDTSRLSAIPLTHTQTHTSTQPKAPTTPLKRELVLNSASSPVSSSPDRDLVEIKTRAAKLTSDDIQMLAQDAVNPQTHQDLRFKSVYLLAQNGHIPEILKQIVAAPIPENLNDRDRDFEHIVRAQAIEGIENSEERTFSKQIISELIQKTDNVFLLDRLNRAKNSLNDTDGSSEVQDNRELEKIIEN